MVDIKYWTVFKRVPSMGTVRFRRLEAYFGDLEKAWNAGLDDRSASDLIAFRGETSPEAELGKVHRPGIKLVAWHDDDYPMRLKEIVESPPVLYHKGTLLPYDARSVAAGATRRQTSYGREVTAGLTGDLPRNGIAVINGLVRGVGGAAHRAALDNARRTITVSGNGLDRIYPREHTNLAQQITEDGAIVSDHPPGFRPDSRSFRRRNRLISGISLGSLVVEAGDGGGVCWTVYHSIRVKPGSFLGTGKYLLSHAPVDQPIDSRRCQASVQRYRHPRGVGPDGRSPASPVASAGRHGWRS